MKTLLTFAMILIVMSLNAQVNTIGIGFDTTKIDGNMVVSGTIRCANIVESDKYGYNSGFQTAYTISLTEDNYVQITNATKTLWTYDCGNGFTESGDTILCSLSGYWGGMFTIRGSGGNGDDYNVRLYDVTAGAEVEYMWLPFSCSGGSNYAGGVLPICFNSVSGHRYVWQIQNISDNDDYSTILGFVWFILMKE
jgi:hypothetical protein